MSSKKKKKDPKNWVRSFTVTDPQLHEKGHTIYCVTSKVFPIDRPEVITEVVVWRRYNDFKKLYQSLLKLHKALHRRAEFPPFAKAKLFGRFEENVIEERRQCAENLLNFAGSQDHLFMSNLFQSFFEGGEKSKLNREVTALPDSPLKPTKTHPDEDNTLVQQQEDIDELSASTASSISSSLISSRELLGTLGGVWKFPAVDEDLNFNSDDNEDTDFTDDSALNTPLPDTDISFFDPLMNVPNSEDQQDHQGHSNAWLLSAMTACAELDSSQEHTQTTESPASNDVFDAQIPDNFGVVSSDTSGTEVPELVGAEADSVDGADLVLNRDSDSTLGQFDPLGSQSESRVECGKGDLELSFAQHPDVPDAQQSRAGQDKTSKSLSSEITSIANRIRSHTAESVTTMDLGGQQDYIYQAANQISLAQQCEANGNFEVAFGYYKNGVSVLLKGVQGDSNKSRREAVRRKTAQYLLKAEDLYNRQLADKKEDQKRWGSDSKISPTVEVDPSIAYLQCPISELQNYSVLGVIDKTMLVMDKQTDQTYVIKVLYKNTFPQLGVQNIIPTHCPYMVQFYKFYETSSAIYLLLQYASGGKLWSYISGYLHSHNRQGADVDKTGENTPNLRQSNAYTGQKLVETEGYDIVQRQEQNLSGVIGEPECSSSYIELFSDYAKSMKQDIDPSVKFSKDSPNRVTYHKPHDPDDREEKKKPNYLSLSSLDDQSEKEDSPARDDVFEQTPKEPHAFQDVLEQAQPSLEVFSINSIDSSDRIRLGSSMSDHIQGIMEVTENSPTHSSTYSIDDSDLENLKREFETDHEDMFSSGSTMKFEDSYSGSNASLLANLGTPEAGSSPKIGRQKNETGEMDSSQEHKDLVNSAKQLLESVEITLSETDKEVAHLMTQDQNPRNQHQTREQIPKVSTMANDPELIAGLTVDENGCCPDTEDKLQLTENGKNANVASNSNMPDACQLGAVRRTSVPSSKDTVFSIQTNRQTSIERSLETPSKPRQRMLSAVFSQLDLAAEERASKCRLPETCVRRWAAEIIVALDKLHGMGIICKDLNPANILLGERGHIMLSYFSQWNTVEKAPNFDAIDQLYSAPEIRQVMDPTKSADWWSVGALLFEMLTGQSLLSCHPSGINTHTALHFPCPLSNEAQSLLNELLRYNPSERLGSGINGIEEVKEHPFFSTVNWNELYY
ncbi:ribosomal protein S6 kinase delta-1 [Lingula anatina]|uniref:Ribosomal protein S6 kinase delta-1 n=1 Tax=Lingula anatina TaxID=7574 RepID=A0A1S3IHY7_LINAN|nr:ribosomal protein S6 kinase delta-1 [Lingula anatina]|eukprot:XP_013397496.1 ribosomal protein S6 kinase delta-1 [Lingula anatina]